MCLLIILLYLHRRPGQNFLNTPGVGRAGRMVASKAPGEFFGKGRKQLRGAARLRDTIIERVTFG